MSKKHHGLQPISGYSVAYWESHQAQLDAGPAFDIIDTAADIAAALNALNTDPHISQIIISDDASVTVNVSQLTSDSTALSKLVNGNSTAASLTVSDTAAHIQASFATVATEGQVTKIVISDNNIVTLTASQASYTVAVGELVNANLSPASVHVKDTAANLATNLNSIESDGSAVTQVIVSNSTTMTLTAQQISQDSDALAKVVYNNGGTVQFKVNDTGANIGTYLDALQAQTKISTITDNNNAAISLSVVQLTSDSGALAKVVNANASPYTLTVADSAANVAGDVSGLNGNTHVASIAISDSAADVQTSLDTLAGVTKTMTIVLTDGTTPTITVTDTQFGNDSSVLGDITSAYNLSVTGVTVAGAGAVYGNSHVSSFVVTDTAAAVQGGIDALESYASKISSIALTDSGTPALTISETQYGNDATVLGDISSAFTLTLTGVAAADAAGLAGHSIGNGTVTQLYVSDSAVNIANNLSGLGGADIVKIVISDGNSIQISISSLEANGTALGSLYESNGSTAGQVTIYDTSTDITNALSTLNSDLQVTKIVVSDNGLTAVTIAQITSYAHALSELYESNGVTLAQLSVSDTALNIQGAFDYLQAASNVNKIIVSDNGTVTIGAESAANDGTALGELYGSDGVTHVQVAVNDTLANIQTYFGGLETNVSHISTITFSGDGTLTLTEAQLVNDASVYAKLGSAFNVDVTNVAAADVNTVISDAQANGNATLASIAVTDTAEHVQSALSTLAATSSLGDIHLTDGATLTFTESQLNAAGYQHVLGVIDNGSFNVALTGVLAGNIASDISSVGGYNASAQVGSISVTDSSANVAGAIDTLETYALAGTLTSINLTDSDAMSISETSYHGDTAALALISGSYTLDITGALAADVVSLAGDSHIVSIAVHDTAAHIGQYFDSLNANHVANITISDAGTVAIGAASAAHDTTALGLVYNDNGNAQVIVTDNAGNVSAHLDGVNTNWDYISKIEVTDGASANVTVSVAQLTSDATAIAHMYVNTSNTLESLTVSDSAANIGGSEFDTLNGDGRVTEIVVSGSNEVAISLTQFVNDTTALGELKQSDGFTPADVTVTATAGSILEQFATINSDTQVNKVILSDSPGNEVTVSVAQLSDTRILSELYNSDGTTLASVTVSDLSANISADFNNLNSDTQINKIIASDDTGPIEVRITVAELADTRALGELYQADGVTHASVYVQDTAANISAAFDALNTDSQVNKIIVSDSGSNEVTITAAQAAGDTTALGELYLANGSTPAHVAVSDTAANLATAFAALNANTHVDKIIVSNSGSAEVTLSVAAVLADTTAEGQLYESNGTSPAHVAVADTAVNIANNLAAIQANTSIDNIYVADSAVNISSQLVSLSGLSYLTGILITDSGTLSVSESVLTGYSATIGLITNASFNIAVTGVAASDASSIAADVSSANAHAVLTSISVSDLASDVASHLGSLNTLAHLASIHFTDGGTPLLAITEGQLADTTALGLINTDNASFDVAVAGVLAADASGIAAQVGAYSHATLTSISVSDTGVNVGTSLDSLNGLANLTAINLTSGALTITEHQLAHDGTALALINTDNGSYNVAVTNVLAADATSIAGDVAAYSHATLTAISVSDTAVNVVAQIGTLNALAHLAAITLTDSGTPLLTITESQLTTDTTALADITNATYDITVTSATAANAATDASGNSHVTSIYVNDTAANIAAHFGSLNSTSQVTQIVVSNGPANEVTVAVATALADSQAESLLYQSDGTTPAHIAVSDTAVNVANNYSGLNGNSHINHVYVVDSASQVANYFNQLNNVHNLAIALNDGGTPTLNIYEYQFLGDTNTMAAIANATYDIVLYQALAANVASDAANPHVTAINVYDTEANIEANFDGLNAAIVSSISFNVSGEVTVSAHSAATDTHAELLLSEESQSVAVSDTAVNVVTYASQLNGNSYVNSVTVVDSAANVVANIGALNSVDHLHITLADSGTPALTITETELTTDTTALGAIANSSFDIAVTGVLASDVGNIAGDVATANTHATLTSISVTDTAANISTAFNTLNATAHVTQVVVSDSGAGNEVTVSVAQLADTALLGELYDANGSTPANVTVSDTASDISAALSTLNSDLQVNKIVVSDNGLTAVTIAQLTTYAHALNELYDSNGVTPASLTVTDTAANISTAIDTLEGASRVSKIIVDDSGAGGVVTIDIAQAGDTHALSELYQANGTDQAYATVADTASNISVDFGDLVNNSYVNKFVVTDNAALAITANQATGYSGTFSEFFQSNGSTPAVIDVVDTASHIAANFDNLGGIGLTRIIVSDSGSNEMTLSASSAVSDTAAESILYQSNGTSPANIAVLDTADNISGVLDQLNSNSQVDHIIISDDGSITLGAASAVNDSHALGELTDEDASPVSLIINDTAANITTYLDQLNSIATISSAVINDSNSLMLGAAQLVTDSAILGKLAFGSTIEVYDTAANISAHLSDIAGNSDVISIVDSNNAALTVTVDQLGTYAVILSETTNSDGVTPATINVEDTAAHIEAHIADLNGNSTPQEIIISDNLALALSVTEYTGNASLLARLHNADGSAYTLNISDNGANISAALDSLGSDSHIATITDTNEAAITLSVAQITSDAAVLGILVNGDGSPYTLSINDTAANLTTALDSLNLNSHVTSLVVTDNGSGNEVVVSVAQLTTDAHALAELYTDGTLATLANVTVSDTAANLSGAVFDTLNDSSQINNIVVSDSGSGGEVTINFSQFTNDTTALGELYNADSSAANVVVSDTAHNLSYGALDALSSSNQVDHIIVNDSGSGNEVTVCVAELQNDGQALGELYTDNTFSTLASVIVKDSAANISAAFDSLNSDSQVNKIIVGDSGSGNEVTISIAQLGDAAALAELYNADGSAAEVTISDTSAAISADFDNLNSDLQVNKIIAADDGIPEVTITVAQLGDTHALGELYQSDGVTLAEVRISDSATNISTAFDALDGNSRVNSIIVNDGNEVTISVAQLGDTTALGELYQGSFGTPANVAVRDIAANLSGAFDALNGNAQVDKIVVSDSGSGGEVAISVSQYTNDTTALGELYNANGSAAHVAISDTAANLTGSALDTLNGADQVDKIIVSDSGTGGEVSVTVSQLTNDTTALGELYNADGSSAHVAVNDIAANLSGGEFDALNANSQVNKIIVSDSGIGGEVSVSVSQLGTDTTALGELYNADGSGAHVAVSDTASAIQGDLNGLNGNLQVDNIYVTDTASFALSAIAVGTDTRALSLIGADNSGVSISVTDTGANVTTYLNALEANTDVTSITISDNAAITVTAAQLLSTDVDAIGLLVNADTVDYPNVMLIVKDSAADISAHLSDLAGYSSAGREITSVVISDNAAVQVTIGQLTTDGAIIDELSNANGSPYQLNITGNATEVSTALDTLETYALGTHVASITVVGSGSVTVTVDQITSDSAALSKLINENSSPYTLAVQDLASAVSGDLGALNSNTHVTSILLTDGGTPTLTITEGQLSDTTALGEITNGVFGIAVANVLAADASGIAAQVLGANANAVLTSISVTDSGANVGANIGSLNGLAHLTAINLTGGTLTITETALTNDGTVLSLIDTDNTGGYSVAVTNVLAADASGIAAEVGTYSHATLTSISVTDTAAHVQASMASLETLATAGTLTSITLTDGGTPTITLAETAYNADGAALADVVSPYQLTITGVLAADAAGIAGNSHVTSILVVDSAADVQTSIASLETLATAGTLTSITLTDGSTPTITLSETAYSADGAALGKIVSNYDLAITNVLAADAAGIAGNSHVTSISVYDTGAHISASLDALNGNSDVTTIVISDNTALNLAAHSAATDSHALGLLHNQNGNQVTLTVTDLAANIATYLDALNAISTISAISISDNNPLTLQAYQVADDAAALGKVTNSNGQPIVINVSDLAANISTYLDQLEANNYIGTITVSDNLSVTANTSQLTGDSDVLAALVNANGSAGTVTVLDTAANISADLGSLNSDTQVTSLVISNNVQLSLNVAQVVNDTRALGELSNANSSPVTEKVSDSASNIQTYLNNLQADSLITSIVVSNNVALTLTAAEVANDGAALSEVSNKNGGAVTFKVVDTAANITTYLNQLTSSAEFSKIASITVSDNNAVTVSVSQIASDAAALAKLVNQNGNPYTLTVEDLAANLSGSEFDSLNGNTHVTSIIVSDNNAVTISVSQLENDARALGELSNLNGSPYTLTISDTASDIAADLSGLFANGHVQKIVVSNSGSGGTITLSAQQATGYGAALGELYQSNGTSHFLVNVSDTSTNLSTYLNALESIANDLGNITITDNNFVDVSVAQVVSDEAVLSKMRYVGGYMYELSLSDTAANISANITALGTNGRIEQVTVTDNGVVTATYAQYSQYNSLFYAIQGTHYLDITNVTGQAYSSFTETVNGSHQALLQDFYDSHGNLLDQLAYSYNNDGTEVITGSYIQGKPYTSYVQNLNAAHQETSATYYLANGNVYENQTFTYNQDGTTSEVITGLSGITQQNILIDHSGNYENTFTYYTNNTVTAYFYENGQTFTSNGEATSINIMNGTSGDTFNLNGSFGEVGIYNYLPGSETINWDHHDFANIAAVEAATHAYGSNGTIVKLDTNDYVILQGVTVAQFEAHTSDWHFI